MSIEVFPVVHINDEPQAREQTEVAFEAGADGIYLIDHHTTSTDLLFRTFNEVMAAHPDQYIGVNLLQARTPWDAFNAIRHAHAQQQMPILPDGLWHDDASRLAIDTEDLRNSDQLLRDIRYLGGVSFKYTKDSTDDPNEAREHAELWGAFVDVVTTSGKGTGFPPSPEKIAAMKAAIGDQPLAVASGVDITNIASYTGNLDQLLVASSVETEPGSGIFDTSKLKDLIDAAHEL